MQPRRKTAIWSNDTEAVASGRGQPGAQQQVGMGAHGTRHTARAKSCSLETESWTWYRNASIWMQYAPLHVCAWHASCHTMTMLRSCMCASLLLTAAALP